MFKHLEKIKSEITKTDFIKNISEMFTGKQDIRKGTNLPFIFNRIIRKDFRTYIKKE